MRITRFSAALALVAGFLCLGSAHAQPEKEAQPAAKTYKVPFKLTIPKHIVVRLKFNGKGPFNFILDTGAPALIVATKVAKKAGLEPNASGWGTIARMEVEGGVVIQKARARIMTPFQLEGMNGMGLAGVEIHGLIGYQVLAKYRMEIDFTSDKMVWTELAYNPIPPKGMGAKGGSGDAGGLQMFGSMMKSLGSILGRKPAPDVTLRGFFGMSLVNGEEFPKVEAVLDSGPAGEGGLRVGDVITHVQDRTVTSVADVVRRAGRVGTGNVIKLTVKRGTETKEISFKTAEGI